MKTITQTAKLLGVSRVTVWYRYWHGKIQAEKVGNQFIIEDAEVERLLKEAGKSK